MQRRVFIIFVLLIVAQVPIAPHSIVSVVRGDAGTIVGNSGPLQSCAQLPLQTGNLCSSTNAVLYTDFGEKDPSYDYYAVKLTVQNVNASADRTWTIREDWVDLTFAPDTGVAFESPVAHQPTAGNSGGPTTVTVSFGTGGISFSVTLAGNSFGTSTDYTTNTDNTGFNVHWHQCAQFTCPYSYIFYDYAQYAVGVAVPESSGLRVYIHTGVTVGMSCDTGACHGNYATTSVLGTMYYCCKSDDGKLDFSLNSNPTSLDPVQGTSANSIINLQSWNGFSGTVNLSASGTAGLTTAFSASSVVLSPGGGSSILTVTASNSIGPGTYSVLVTGTSGSLSHSVTIPITVRPPDFTISLSASSYTQCSGDTSMTAAKANVQGVGGFPQTILVSLSASSSPSNLNPYMSPNQVYVPGTGQVVIDTGSGSSGVPIGTYTVTVTGTSGSLSHSASMSVIINAAGSCISGGNAGSVASGSLITMEDGSNMAVQDVQVGQRVIVYDVVSRDQTIATITQIVTHSSDTLLTLHTSAGLPFRADANPHMRLHVLVNGQIILKQITEIHPGDQIYNWDLQSWVTVTGVTVASGGQHTMYDLVTDPQLTASGAVLEYIANGYPDCPGICKN